LIKNTIVPLLKQSWLESEGQAQFEHLIEASYPEGFNMSWVWVRKNGTPQSDNALPKDFANLETIDDSQVKNDFDLEREIVTSYIPIKLDNSNGGVLKVNESLRPLRNFSKSSMMRTVILTLSMICLGAIVTGIFGYRMVGFPVRKLQEKAKKIGQGDNSTDRIIIGGKGELSELSDSLETLSKTIEEGKKSIIEAHEEKLAIVKQLRHTDRLKTVGGLASGVAHEMGTPLNVISGRASLISSGKLDSDEIRESADIIKSEANRLITIIQELLNFARRRPLSKGPVELNDVVKHTISMLQPMLTKKHISLELNSNKKIPKIEGDENQIQQVVTNILVNAIDATPERGRIVLDYDFKTLANPNKLDSKEHEYVVMNIEDNGCGMDDDLKLKIFDPFFTTKDIGKGTGLGLSIVHGIIAEHHGWVQLSTTLGKGSKFSIFLPPERHV